MGCFVPKVCCLGTTSLIFALIFANDAWTRFADAQIQEGVSTLEKLIATGPASAAGAILCFLLSMRFFGKCPGCCFDNRQEREWKQSWGAEPSLL